MQKQWSAIMQKVPKKPAKSILSFENWKILNIYQKTHISYYKICYLFHLKVVNQTWNYQVFLTYLIERDNSQKALLMISYILLREQAIYLHTGLNISKLYLHVELVGDI